jgi:hypothetical protein
MHQGQNYQIALVKIQIPNICHPNLICILIFHMTIQLSPMGFCDISAQNIQAIHISISPYLQIIHAYQLIVVGI